MNDLRDGMLSPLLRAAMQHGLDLQIREEYINLYYRGLSAIKVMRAIRGGGYSATLHVKYLAGTVLPCEIRRNDRYAVFEVGTTFVDEYVRQLAVITANADNYWTPEGDAEQALVRNSIPGSPLLIVDRQIQVHGVRKRADVIGVTHDAECLLIGEIKCGLNNDIQHIPRQLDSYYKVLAGRDGRVRQQVACTYRKVIAQKQALGALSPQIAFPSENPRVGCLVILCDYKSRSKLLGRARDHAKDCGAVIWVVMPTGSDYRVPDRSKWEQLCP